MKYFLDMSANDRVNYRRFKRTLEIGATTKSVITVNPTDIKDKPKSKLAKVAKAVLKKILLQQNVTKEEVNLLLEYMEEKDNG